MPIRQFLAVLMIFLSLSAQARTELACGMSPRAAVMSDCCPPQVQPQSDAGIHTMPCCDQVTPSDAPLAHAANLGDGVLHGPLLDAVFHPVLLSDIPSSHAISIDVDRRFPVNDDVDEGRRKFRPLYLQTARLRL